MLQMNLFDELIRMNKDNTLKEKPFFNDWILVDGNNLINRTYYVTEKVDKRSPDGKLIPAVRLALNMVLEYQEKLNAQLVFFFDKGRGFRANLYPEYKANRDSKPTPPGLTEQMETLKEVLSHAQIPVFTDELLEADDLIASAANNLNGHKYILSNDKDLLQLVSSEVTVVARKGKEDVYYTPERFEKEWGLKPVQIVDVKALAGDSSDNIKGVAGIGEKGAKSLIEHFGTIEAIKKPFPKPLFRYEKYFDEVGVETAAFCKVLTTLKINEFIKVQRYHFSEYGLKSVCSSLGIYLNRF